MAETPKMDYIKEIAGGNEEFERRFLSIIQEEFPKERDDYEAFMEAGDLEEAAKVVHKVKHKLGILSMNADYKVAVNYEEALKLGKTDQQETFREILDAVTAFIVKLEGDALHNSR